MQHLIGTEVHNEVKGNKLSIFPTVREFNSLLKANVRELKSVNFNQ